MLKKLSRFLFITCVCLLSALIFYTVLLADSFQSIFPYRFYNVLTDSMEPAIRTDSLVLAAVYKDSMKIKKNDIIIFLADRFGEKTVIMHRFSHTETRKDGSVIYRTCPERSDTPDIYETASNDILGIYLWHIPYAGKFILFLKSPFGLLWICQIILILLINQLILVKWKSEEENIL